MIPKLYMSGHRQHFDLSNNVVCHQILPSSRSVSLKQIIILVKEHCAAQMGALTLTSICLGFQLLLFSFYILLQLLFLLL